MNEHCWELCGERPVSRQSAMKEEIIVSINHPGKRWVFSEMSELWKWGWGSASFLGLKLEELNCSERGILDVN